jgi:hypothetical protein
MSVVDMVPPEIREDLAKSGLDPSDMRCRPMGPNEQYATNTPGHISGYVIPYFDIRNKPIPFYRVRLSSGEIRYKQLANQPNHIYFPPGFWALLMNGGNNYVCITEGEKKASCAVKNGIPCVAVGGVDSWRNRIVFIPKGSGLVQGQKNAIVAKLPSGSETQERTDSLAIGLLDLISVVIARRLHFVICYDGDERGELSFEAQAAAASLGFELRYRGIPGDHIRQLQLKPHPSFTGDKLGLDDFLCHEKLGPRAFEAQLKEVLNAKSAFPRHPNPKSYVNKRLQRARIPRADMQALSTAILCDLDCGGSRLRCPDDGRLYYFHKTTHELIPVHFRLKNGFANSPFGVHLYRNYNLGGADLRLMEWLETQFTGEKPIIDVDPERVMTIRGDTVYYQITQGKMAKVTNRGIQIVDNGSDDILFEADVVEDMDENALLTRIEEISRQKTLVPFWYQTLKESRIPESENDAARRTLALLYSISPFFYRWRGTQLPIEMMIAEPGSGKSTLFELRLDILTGRPRLRNAPRDLRDWTAGIASTGGLHVTDNVNLNNSQLRQELSDEICRIITEPNPTIEARKLYTDNEVAQTKVKCVFAVTAVRQPFNNPDILQRSIITILDKGSADTHYEADWEKRQLARFGGREGWMAHHLVLIHRLLKLIETEWDPHYRAKFRLINVEQLLRLTARLFDWDSDWIAPYLEEVRDKSVAEADWALEGLLEFGNLWRDSGLCDNKAATFGAKEISEWAASEEDFNKCAVLINSRQLANYIKRHKNLVSRIAGISEAGSNGNRSTFYAHKIGA